MKREFEKASLAEKKAIEEVQWLKNQLADQKLKLREAMEENDEL